MIMEEIGEFEEDGVPYHLPILSPTGCPFPKGRQAAFHYD
jgi:hypothetical protein